MVDYVVPCETVARLSNLTAKTLGPWFASLRIEYGICIACDGGVMAVEKVTGGPGIIHLILDPQLIEVCTKEGAYKSDLTITVIPELQIATCKTTYGYIGAANCVVWDQVRSKFDTWRNIVTKTQTDPPTDFNGGMYWGCDQIYALAHASPTGGIVFPEYIDINKPVIVRDAYEDGWFGLFNPWGNTTDNIKPATLPSWFK